MTKYDDKTEAQMRLFFCGLPEKEQRHYAAQAASKLGYGGKKYISTVLGISESRIRRGILELTDKTLYAEIPNGKQRRIGGGRKKKRSVPHQ